MDNQKYFLDDHQMLAIPILVTNFIAIELQNSKIDD